MGTKEGIIRLFQKLIDETITAEEFNQFYTYVKRSKTNPEIRQILTKLWDYTESKKDASPDDPDEAGFKKLQKNIRLLDLLVDSNTQHPDEIDEIIRRIVKGHYN